MESIDKGVIFNSIEEVASCDSIAALRPKLSRKEKAVALLEAFHYSGRPYDFNFDFLTDSTLTCAEFLSKSYAPSEDSHGLRLPLKKVVGRYLIMANDIARQFDEEFGTEVQQLDFVTFLDGRELANKAFEATVGEFRESWKRPEWHLLAQDATSIRARIRRWYFLLP